ncbi:phage tail tube protein [Agrobacterium pusense]|uniref:phage tail tube protein n=1 Tax=Agrobacterium pusense TaxID=648995 RepID=UPI002FE3F40E
MAQATTIKGGKIRVLLGNSATPIVYSAPCGFTQRSITLNKGLEEVQIPDCTDPDKVDWVGRDATSLSMSISGEGVLASESVDTWLEGFDKIDSIPAKVEWEFPAKTITWTGKMHIESMEVGASNGQRATNNVSMQSDGAMVRVTTPKT